MNEATTALGHLTVYAQGLNITRIVSISCVLDLFVPSAPVLI